MSHHFLLGLLGANVAGSATPAMHEAEAERQGIQLTYRTLDPTVMAPEVAAGGVRDGEQGGVRDGAPGQGPDWPWWVRLARGMGFDGLNVTHPAKQAVIAALDELTDDAQLLGAVNTIVFRGGRALGANTDHTGFADALRAIAVDAAAGPVVQVGAGGAGSAVAYALLAAGVPRLHLVDLDRGRALALAEHLAAAFAAERTVVTDPGDVSRALAAASGVVNCTPIGMTGVSDASPVPLEALHPGLWVGDAVYRPLETRLVKAARELGCPAFGGSEMAVGQAVAAFELFTGRAASREHIHDTFVADRREESGRG